MLQKLRHQKRAISGKVQLVPERVALWHESRANRPVGQPSAADPPGIVDRPVILDAGAPLDSARRVRAPRRERPRRSLLPRRVLLSRLFTSPRVGLRRSSAAFDRA